ncbi:MAG: NAD(P)/FAD-dependent oxidoreductase [Pseudomonadales bacterium]
MTKSTSLDIAVVGSGICGMCAAMTLASQGHRLTLFERDGPPPAGDADAAFFDWRRTGAAQFRHPHAFLGLMCNLIETHYPELLEAFLQAGARQVKFADMLNPTLQANYHPLPGDEKLWVLLCRRATMETVIRRHVASLKNVEIRNHIRVTGLLTEDGSTRVNATGLTIDESGQHTEFKADLVIDASGRTSRFPGWLKERGLTVPEEKDDAEIVYYTRHYRLSPGAAEPPRGKHPGAGDLGYLKFGVFPGDNGNFAIILCLPIQEKALITAVRSPDRFDTICRSIPGLEPWVREGKSVSTTEPFGIADIQAVWRHFLDERGNPLLHNFFALGDAAVRTNPLYGRGCSLGVLHAQILTEVLATHSDPERRAVHFAERTEAELRPIFEASLREDRSGIRRAAEILSGRLSNKPNTLKKWFSLSFGEALRAASGQEIEVFRGVMRTFHLLEKPGEFLKESTIRRKVLRYMLRGRRKNAAARFEAGPDRMSMHSMLGIL